MQRHVELVFDRPQNLLLVFPGERLRQTRFAHEGERATHPRVIFADDRLLPRLRERRGDEPPRTPA
jgi:hypothetical protein